MVKAGADDQGLKEKVSSWIDLTHLMEVHLEDTPLIGTVVVGKGYQTHGQRNNSTKLLVSRKHLHQEESIWYLIH